MGHTWVSLHTVETRTLYVHDSSWSFATSPTRMNHDWVSKLTHGTRGRAFPRTSTLHTLVNLEFSIEGRRFWSIVAATRGRVVAPSYLPSQQK